MVYVFHYVGLVAGLAGMWLYRRRWRVALPLIGFIIYTTLVHLVLLALPRYIFPTELFWWVFAAGLLARQWGAAPASEAEPAQTHILGTAHSKARSVRWNARTRCTNARREALHDLYPRH